VTPRFGLSTHLFHGERLDGRHLDTIRLHGFDLVELFATATHFDYRDLARVRELRDWLRGAGLTAVSMHGPIFDSFKDGAWGRPYLNASHNAAARQEAIDETRLAIDAARELGCETLVLHLGLPAGAPTAAAGGAKAAADNDPASARRSLEAIADAARGAGVRLALEVIPNALSSPTELVRWMEGDGGLEDAGVCLDLGHAHMMGGVAEAVEMLSGHIITTHVHDNHGREDAHLVPYSGNIDWPGSLTALWKVGYAGPLVFEVADAGDAAAVLTRLVGARGRLQSILTELSQPFDFDEHDGKGHHEGHEGT
jgi:sugar phosphate isomerase/epimerase